MRGWRWIQFPRFRPVYGVERLYDEDGPVLGMTFVVFDEHEAEWGQKLLGESMYCNFVSWPGGIRKIDEVDWSVLRDRTVVIWPTRTMDRLKARRGGGDGGAILPREQQSGWKAAIKLEKMLIGFGCKVIGIADPFKAGDLPEGFGPALAGVQGWDSKRLEDWVWNSTPGGRGSEVQQAIRRLRGEVVSADPEPGMAQPGEVTGELWIPDLIWKKGELSACLSNVYQILSHRPEWNGVIAFDEFALRVVKRKEPIYPGGALGDWTDVDDSRTAMWLSREYGFTPSSALVSEAVRTLAMAHAFHPVRDYLTALKWDGIERLNHWLVDFLGAKDREYVRLASRWWLMGAVKRVLKPGCKFDYCLVLEGAQGKRKSAAFSVIGGEWFGDTDLDFANKDSMIALAGKWFYELAELGALARSDERRQKSFLSRTSDEFRPPYGRTNIKAPRQLVFGGSTNEWEWNKDPTGGRRFWPIECGEIDTEALAAARDQLFAEAYHLVMQGERYWPTPEEQKRLFDPEQLRVEQPDGYIDVLHDWVYEQVMEFSLAKAIINGLNLDASKMTRDLQTRVGIALRKLGCERVERRNGMVRFLYKPPARNGATSTDITPAQPKEMDDEPF